MSTANALSESIYDLLTDEEDARACAEISDAACHETPRSFVLILCSHFLTKVGDAIANPKTVLSWVMSGLQVSPTLIGFLMPIRESGSLLPQLVIGGWVRRMAVRKWVWIAGALLQAMAVAGMAIVAVTLRGPIAGWALLACLTGFSLARGLSSVAAKDVLGKTVPKRRRGQLTGWSASIAGLSAVGLGVFLLLPHSEPESSGLLGLLLLGAAVLWLAAAATYALIPEAPGATDGSRNAIRNAFASLALLIKDRPFRRFVITRSLLLCSALNAPFYVLLARENVGAATALLGTFVVADGLANLISAPVWGRFADSSSRWVMMVAGAMSATVGIAVYMTDELRPSLVATNWFVPIAYFSLSVAHGGVRVGRKTYVVDLADGNRRTDYVTVSNTVIGVVLLLTGSIGALAGAFGTSGVIFIFSVMGFAGAMLASTLPEVQRPE
jgi:MFS family permease